MAIKDYGVVSISDKHIATLNEIGILLARRKGRTDIIDNNHLYLPPPPSGVLGGSLEISCMKQDKRIAVVIASNLVIHLTNEVRRYQVHKMQDRIIARPRKEKGSQPAGDFGGPPT